MRTKKKNAKKTSKNKEKKSVKYFSIIKNIKGQAAVKGFAILSSVDGLGKKLKNKKNKVLLKVKQFTCNHGLDGDIVTGKAMCTKCEKEYSVNYPFNIISDGHPGN